LPGKDAAASSRSRDEAREQVRAMQRRYVLDAMAYVVAERGTRGATIGRVCKRANVTSSVFRNLFPSLDACLLELQEQVVTRCTVLIIEAFKAETSWLDGVLAGLEALLVFLDREPELARVCLVESLAGSQATLERRLDLLESLKPLVDGVREQLPNDDQPIPSVAEATIASLTGILHARLVAGKAPPFVGLLGELAGIVVAPYLGTYTATREMERANARAQVLIEEMRAGSRPELVSIPKGLRHGKAVRRRLCLEFVAESPGASNQAIAVGIDLPHLGQTSTTLSSLEKLGLLVKRAGRPGHPNAWSLSPYGKQVARALDYC
jgi:AcrR family transcriptional regulator